MDLTKAQRLLNKIQAFLDNGNSHELSRLERDLIKSYVQQLYEVVTMDEPALGQEPQRPMDVPLHKNFKSEPPPKAEIPTLRVTEVPKPEVLTPAHAEYVNPVHRVEPLIKPERSVPEMKEKALDVEEPKTENKPTRPIAEPKKEDVTKHEPAKETFHAPKHVPSQEGQDEPLHKLFEVQKSDEMGSRFSHVPIESIESAMGLNERIFTLNELFGGDKALFDAWCTKLNSLHSYAEAKNVLMEGPAKDFKWSDPERIKMAEQFIRIVSRRYPKAVS